MKFYNKSVSIPNYHYFVLNSDRVLDIEIPFYYSSISLNPLIKNNSSYGENESINFVKCYIDLYLNANLIHLMLFILPTFCPSIISTEYWNIHFNKLFIRTCKECFMNILSETAFVKYTCETNYCKFPYDWQQLNQLSLINSSG